MFYGWEVDYKIEFMTLLPLACRHHPSHPSTWIADTGSKNRNGRLCLEIPLLQLQIKGVYVRPQSTLLGIFHGLAVLNFVLHGRIPKAERRRH